MCNPQPDWLLLDRFLAGECSPAEAECVRQWLDEHPESAAALDVFRKVLDRQAPSAPAPPVWDTARAWSRLDAVTRENVGAQYRLPPPLRQVSEAEANQPVAGRAPFNVGRGLRPARSSWLRTAAVVLLVGGGAWYWVDGMSSRTTATARIMTTQRSERSDLRLADGTRVVLAPESRLTIPADFGTTHRELTLVGEGYFEVVHDSAKPFLVHAAHGVIHDLGTRFSVRAYPTDSVVQVVVAEGRVMTGLAGASFPLRGPVLGRGDLARLDTAGAVMLTRGIDVDRYQSWVQGRLRFTATPLREVLLQLTRWYGVDFQVADAAVGSRRMTSTFRDESLEQVLSTIAQVTDTRYERTAKGFRFSALPGTSLTPRAPQ